MESKIKTLLTCHLVGAITEEEYFFVLRMYLRGGAQ